MNGFIMAGLKSVQGFTRFFDMPQGRGRFMVRKNWKEDIKDAVEREALGVDWMYIMEALTHDEFEFDSDYERKDNPYILFFHAAIRGKTKVVKFLVENKYVDVNFKDKRGWTAMDYAQKTRRYDVIHYLVEAGAVL